MKITNLNVECVGKMPGYLENRIKKYNDRLEKAGTEVLDTIILTRGITLSILKHNDNDISSWVFYPLISCEELLLRMEPLEQYDDFVERSIDKALKDHDWHNKDVKLLIEARMKKKACKDEEDLVKVAEDIFDTALHIEMMKSGGIAPGKNIEDIKKTGNMITIFYRYDEECGLSDCVYHPVQVLQSVSYQFDKNGIFDGKLSKEFDLSHFLKDETQKVIDEFITRHPEQAIAL